jgi:hypothetical protein
VLTANFLARLPALEQDFPIRAKNVWVQAFRDTRTSRRNLGDIVFAYRTPTELSAEETAALRSLLPVLDERIPFSEAPAAKKKLVACAGAATVGGGGPAADDAAPVGVLVVVSLLVLARRRPGRAAALAALVIVSAATTLSCRRSGLATGSDPRERAVVELLAGKPPYRIVPAAEPELVTTVTIDGLASSPADLPVAADVERARARIGDCLRVQLPEPVAVEVEFGADDNVKAARVPALKNADVRARVEGCWKNMWFEKKSFAPGSTARVSFRMTLKHELRE